MRKARVENPAGLKVEAAAETAEYFINKKNKI
jgi:hypothetical protein